ncbi:Zn-dependent oligopeptidase [Microbacterium sp. SORGH_AS 505]|nr:Zn-dependent oligopeptidase [Microbacterium sp. SORGH_AS_0505]
MGGALPTYAGTMTDAATNPLLSPSPLPFDLPDYPSIRPEHYLPAFEQAFASHRAEIDAIATSSEEPTFENTLVALEQSGEPLGRIARTFYTVSSANATAEIQEIDEQLAPLMAAHHDAVTLDAHLYARVAEVHARLEELGLEGEDRYLVERTYREMTGAGAGLDEADKTVLTELNQQLSMLTTTFEKNLLADTNDLAVVFDDAAELDGLTDGELSAAARNAAERGLEGKYVVTLTLFTGHPYLSSLTSRTSRERLMAASRSRGRRGNANDNREVLTEIVRLRSERARVLGYDSHAAYVTADETAGSPEAVHDLLRRLAVPAAANARQEQAALQEIIDGEGGGFPLAAHDWAFYTERVRSKPGTTSIGPLCAPGSRPNESWSTACSARRRISTASRSPSVLTFPRITPGRVSSRSGTRTAPTSGSTSWTCTHGTPSVAGRG